MCLQTPSLLLGLPTELRLQIYDGVVHLPIDCEVARRPSSQQPGPAQPAPVLSIPWLSLALVCKTITEELRDYLHTSGNTTYELEIDNTDPKQKQRSIPKTVTWRRIPCPPSSVRTLKANLVLHFGTRFWGCGGPMPILSQLYQVLNHFIHNGPFLARQSPLVNRIHLSTLIVQLCVKNPDPEERRAQGRQPYDKAFVDKQKKRHRGRLQTYVSRVVARGLLFGAVDKIVCRWAEGEFDDDDKVREWEVSSQEIGDMTEWEQYGFEWGVPGSSSLAGQSSQSDVST
ncbi:hypothetical protein MSAN_01944700 [Mycena sanguinolenta]|uniref:Uncharacterized protein n=1 Tax=Mycena sanguinolenta TaxID=230812 RepID=A0A8H6XPZ6_9AGAR|nr:hypothetical protein MSAN_01944700 [Mycena sanguinolenta]